MPVRAGDRIWWDYRDWTDVMRVPAVVGSFPEPLAQESARDPEPVRLECAEAEEACAAAGERLAEAGVDFTNERFGSGAGAGATCACWSARGRTCERTRRRRSLEEGAARERRLRAHP